MDIWDTAIIGSGPAGLTAAIYAVRGAASTLLLAGESWGGQLMLTTLVENFPGFADGAQGPDIMMNMRKQAERLGVKWIGKNVDSVDLASNPFKLYTGGENYLAKSIIVATGADTLWLGVPGENKLIGRGVSSCAPCDAPFFKGKTVAVVGGGDAAMEEALVLTKYASEVTIIHRRDEFRASAIMQQKVLTNPKIKILWDTEVVEILGETKIEKLILKNIKSNLTSDLFVNGLFVAVGHSPSSKIFQGKVNLDEKGYIKKVPNEGYEMTTSVSGVFVSGDVHDHHYRQAITAAGFGCMAGIEALKYIEDLTHKNLIGTM